MNRVKMCEKQFRRSIHRQTGLNQTAQGSESGVEEETLPRGLDQRADSGPSDTNCRSRRRAQERDFDVRLAHSGLRLSARLRRAHAT